MSETRREYRTLSPEEVSLIDEIKARGGHLIDLLKCWTPSRENALAITKVEEAVMWAVKGITR
jgi:hypothetical protein